MKQSNREYIGDGTSVEFDGYQYRLTTSNGITITNSIYLDEEVFVNLIKYRAKTMEKYAKSKETACHRQS